MRSHYIAQELSALWRPKGKESKREGIYVSVWLIHFAVQ